MSDEHTTAVLQRYLEELDGNSPSPSLHAGRIGFLRRLIPGAQPL
jgi:hypothetical protein